MPKRTKYDITIIRLSRMSPADLIELGKQLRELAQGQYILDCIADGFRSGREKVE